MWALALACALMDGIINKLGDDRFAVREKAARQLKVLDVVALPALQHAFETADDPEVKYRAKVLIQEFMYPDVPDGMWAESIWNLPNDYRYTEEDNFSIDNAQLWYEQVWEAQKAQHRHEAWSVQTLRYNDEESEYEALVLFIADQRLKGMTIGEYHKLYERIIDNRKFGWHVQENEWGWDHFKVPSPILTKQVTEGVQ